MNKNRHGHTRGQQVRIEAMEDRTFLTTASIVMDINPGPAWSYASQFVEVRSRVLFLADDGQHGSELWQTDGTSQGTTMVKDAAPGPDGSSGLVRLGDSAVFFAIAGQRLSLWTTDGTPDGTRSVRDILVANHGRPWLREVVSAGNLAFFIVHDGMLETLWRTDGTAEGTLPLLHQTIVGALRAYDGRLFCQVADPDGEQQWVSDGTIKGTRRFADFAGLPASAMPRNAIPFKGGYIFNMSGEELWWTDGTPTGAERLGVVLISDGTEDTYIEMGRSLYFGGEDGSGQWGLWKTDGTASGTVLVAPRAHSAVRLGEELFFRARTPDDSGFALWKTDGTAAGNVMLGAVAKDIMLGVFPGSWIGTSGGLVYAYGYDEGGAGIYQSDGTVAGTKLILRADAQAFVGEFGGKLLFTAESEASGRELWQIQPPAWTSSRPQLTGPTQVLRNGAFTLSLRSASTVQFWTINWGDGVIENVKGDLAQVTHRYVKTGRYRVAAAASVGRTMVRAMAGATRAQSLIIEVNNPRPRPSIAAADAMVPGQPVAFAGRTNDGTMRGCFVAWDFGDGSKRRPKFAAATPSALNPSHVFRRAGTYTVRMWVRNPAGKVGVAKWKVRMADTVMQRQPDRPGERALVVGGTAGNDVIQVMHRWGGRMEVVINGKSRGLFAADRLIVHAGDGDDVVRVDDMLEQPVELYGDKGFDRLHAVVAGAVVVGEIIE